MNLFTVVRFPNTACSGNNGYNGTCYSAEECDTRNGASGGSCANGYGVCCTCMKNFFDTNPKKLAHTTNI